MEKLANVLRVQFRQTVDELKKDETWKNQLELLRKERTEFVSLIKHDVLKKYNLPDDTDDRDIEEIYKAEKDSTKCEGCTGLENCKQSCEGFQPLVNVDDNGKVSTVVRVCRFRIAENSMKKIRSSNIPRKYIGKTFDDYDVDNYNEVAVNNAKKTVRDCDKGAYFYGKPGTGKTFLAAIVAQELIKKGKSVVFVNVPVLLREIQETWKLKTDAKGDKVTEMMILKTLYSCDVLILDDLGAENQSAWSVNTLYGIINERYGKELPTIITSNFSLEEMEEVLTTDKTGSPIKASQIIDRLYDSDLFRNIEFFGKSRRRKRNQ